MTGCGREPEPLAVARLRSRRGQRSGGAASSGRLLLQDLHVAEGRLEASLRAADPQRGRPRHRARPARSRPLRLALRPLRGAGGRRRRGRACGSARRGRDRPRHPVRRAGRASAARCASRAARRSTASPAGTGRRRRSRSWRSMDNVRILPRTTAFGYYAQNMVGLVERVTDHLARPARSCRASGCGMCAPSGWCSRPAPSSATWCLPATTGRASCSPRPRAPISTITACGRPARRRLHGQRFRLWRRARPAPAGVKIA
jgi:hypothetical protein